MAIKKMRFSGVKGIRPFKVHKLFIYLLLLIFLVVSCHHSERQEWLKANGTIEAHMSRIAPKVSGRVLKVAVTEGQVVKPGALLVELDHDYLDLQLQQAEATVEQAKAQLRLLQQGARSEDIGQAEQQLKQAEINLSQARIDAQRFHRLYEQGGVTQKQKEDADNRLSLAEAQYAQAQENLKKLKAFSRPEEIRAAEARLAQAEAAADLLKQNIRDSVVTSPIAGVITERVVEPGELVNPGSTLVTISILDPVYLWIYISEKDLGRIKLGDEVRVKIDSFSDKDFIGKITYISPEAEFTPKNVQTEDDRVKLVFGVKVELRNPEGWLKPGLPADAYLKIH